MRIFFVNVVVLLLFSCKHKKENRWIPLIVTATAYNSLPSQTSTIHPAITAWGDSVRPNVRWIAVSQDLLKKGIRHNTKVKIDTFDGVYLVKDKMHKRWKNSIDIFMSKDIAAARKWGRKKLTIYYEADEK